MRKVITLLAVAAILSGTTNTALSLQSCHCQKPFQKKAQHFKQKRESIYKQLNLTKEQKKQINKLRTEKRTKIKPIFKEMKAIKIKLNELKQNNACKNVINKERAKLKPLKKQIRTIRNEHQKKVNDILTPEQRIKFNQLKLNKQEQMKKFKHKHQHKFYNR